jgi:hypothetical protein
MTRTRVVITYKIKPKRKQKWQAICRQPTPSPPLDDDGVARTELQIGNMKEAKNNTSHLANPVMPAEQLINLKSTRSCVPRPPSPLPSSSTIIITKQILMPLDESPLHLLQ